MHLLIIGCGYVGLHVAKEALSKGWRVSALTRSEERAAKLRSDGIFPIIGNVLDPESLKTLPSADLCCYSVGFDRTSGESKDEVYVTGVRNVLGKISAHIPRLLYISSTSVYGEANGDWVDENTECQPTMEGGKFCLEAEKMIHEVYGRHDTHRATILRLSGIYGPGRLIGRKEQLSEEVPIRGNPNGWLNLIHVDDILQGIFAIFKTEDPKSTYLLSDERPNRRLDFYTELAKHLGTPPPVMNDEVSANLGKRCNSSRIRNELKIKLIYPTVETGIPASIQPS